MNKMPLKYIQVRKTRTFFYCYCATFVNKKNNIALAVREQKKIFLFRFLDATGREAMGKIAI
jgi:hypothetical protein